MDKFKATPTVAERLDEAMLVAERTLMDNHKILLEDWTRAQLSTLAQAQRLDTAALEAFRPATDGSEDLIRADMARHTAQRAKVLHDSAKTRASREVQFQEHLRGLSAERAADLDACVRSSSSAIRGEADHLEESEWALFEATMGRVAKQRGEVAQSLPMVFAQKVGDLRETELRKHLDAEYEGWTRSQQSDLQRLFEEVEIQSDAVFKRLAAAVAAGWPGSSGSGSARAELERLAAAHRVRLAELREEVAAIYAQDLDAASSQVETMYHSLDGELQKIVFRTMENRVQSEADMRDLKLALARWRLDYRKTFRLNCSKLSEDWRRHPSRAPAPDLDAGRRHLRRLRHVVHETWAQGGAPLAEVHAFIGRAAEAAARGGKAKPLLRAYEAELNRYGALPLLEHADKPEILSCWLDALKGGASQASPALTREFASPGGSPGGFA